MDTNRNQEPSNKSHRDDFRSDASKLAQKHLSDPNHVITEEDMKKIRVGVSSGPDAPTRQAVKDAEDRIADSKSNKDDDTLPGGQKVTPWDTLNP
jgi:hypothetical protein